MSIEYKEVLCCVSASERLDLLFCHNLPPKIERQRPENMIFHGFADVKSLHRPGLRIVKSIS